VNALFLLLRHLSSSAPYLYICSCVYLGARAALACMRVVAGVIVIAARDKRSRAERALDVLRALGRDRQPPEEDKH
jgi:hypothetical protein